MGLLKEKRTEKDIGSADAIQGRIGKRLALYKEVRRLKLELESLQSETQLETNEIERLKKEAGEAAYSRWRQGSRLDGFLNEYFQKLDQKYKNMEELKLQIADIKRQIAEQKKEYPEEAAGLYVCPSCHAAYKINANFCRKCGTLMNQEYLKSGRKEDGIRNTQA